MRLEYKRDTSNKFWDISIRGSSYTVVFGRIGSAGQRKTTTCSSAAAARTAMDKLMASKKKKGYLEVGGAKAKAAKPPAKKKKRGKPVKLAEIKKLVRELDRLTRIYLEGEEEDPNDTDRYELYKPATAKEIAAHEKTLGASLPPSYRHFLKLHNGWLGFWGDSALLGVPKPYNKARYKYINSALRESNGYLDEDDEPDDPDFFRSENVIPIAEDHNGGFVGFDKMRVDGRGEYQVIDCENTNGCVDNRFRDFVAFMKMRIHCTKRWIEEQDEDEDEDE